MRAWMIPAMAVVVLAAGAAWAEEPAGLTLSTAQPAAATTVSATGRVVASASARISPRVSGHLLAFGKDAQGRTLDVGMIVKKDQVLFELNTTTLVNAQASATAMLESAKASLANLTAKTREERLEQFREAVKELDVRIEDKMRDEARYRRLVEEDKTAPAKRLEEVRVELGTLKALQRAATARLREAEAGPTKTEIAVAEARVKEAETAVKVAGDDLRDATVRAPYVGLITRRFKSVGDYIAANPPTEVIELVSVDELEAEVRLPESYLARVQAGQTPATVQSSLLKTPVAATITRVVGDVDPAKGTFACRIAIPAEQRNGLVAGAFVTAEISLDGKDQPVIVPQRALKTGPEGAVVYVASGGKMARRTVQIGDRLTEGVILKSGLQPGESVVLGPTEAMKDGAPLPAYLTKK